MSGDHGVTRFADPFLVCETCGRAAIGFHRTTQLLVPCGHLGVKSLCPSWGPVDGCRCLLHLGHVPHPEPLR